MDEHFYAARGPAHEISLHVFASAERRQVWLERHADDKEPLIGRAVSVAEAEEILREAQDTTRTYHRIKLHTGTSGDPLAVRCLAGEVLPVPSTILPVIERLRFVYAKTMPWMPHEYTLRERAADDCDYVALYDAIMRHGIVERWRGVPARYLYPGDGWRYWSMSAKRSDAYARHPLFVSHHINRNIIEETDGLTPL